MTTSDGSQKKIDPTKKYHRSTFIALTNKIQMFTSCDEQDCSAPPPKSSSKLLHKTKDARELEFRSHPTFS
jgi:hypothetical protein